MADTPLNCYRWHVECQECHCTGRRFYRAEGARREMAVACRLGYAGRQMPWLTLPLMAAWSAAAIAYFPLHLGGGIPFWPTAGLIFVSLIILYAVGYVLLRRTPLWDAK